MQYEIIQQWQYLGKPHPKLLEDRAFEECKKIGITSLQSYVFWAEIEQINGKIDFSSYDILVDKIKKNGLKWVPFLIIGPNYATPSWFQNSKDSVYAKCLEHQKESKIQSIWNPNLAKYVERFLRIVAEHYQNKSIFESITLGISGNWGEALYPSGGGFYENFHTHQGFWCGDKYAKKDFSDFAIEKYKSLQEINSVWKTDFKNYSDITFPPFKKKEGLASIYRFFSKSPKWLKSFMKLWKNLIFKFAKKNKIFWEGEITIKPSEIKNNQGRQRWLDFIEWYVDSMNRWAELWLNIARKYFPDTEIYLVTGGNGNPVLGADFSAQAKLAKKYNAGVRITNQTDDYPQSFFLTRLVSSAARFYGNYFTTEEAEVNKPEAIPMRIFDVISSGARGFYCKSLIGTGKDICAQKEIPLGKPTKGASNLKKNISFLENRNLENRNPIIETTVFFPSTSIIFNCNLIGSIYYQAFQLRDLIDFDLIDENLIRDDALSRYKFLVILDGHLVKEEIFQKIKDWIKNGGIIISSADLNIVSFYNKEKLFMAKKELEKFGKGYKLLFTGKDKNYLKSVSEAVYNSRKKYPWEREFKIDGEIDKIYATRFGNKVFYYNQNKSKIKKRVKINNSFKFVDIDSNSIVSMPLK